MRGREAGEHFFVAGNQLHMLNENMWATLQEDESDRQTAQVLFFGGVNGREHIF